MKTEIDAMKQLTQNHICKMYQVIETDTKFFMILEVRYLKKTMYSYLFRLDTLVVASM